VASGNKWINGYKIAAKTKNFWSAARFLKKLIYGILRDFVIDSRGARFSKLLHFTGSSRLDDAETLVDIKGLGIGESSDCASFRAEQG